MCAHLSISAAVTIIEYSLASIFTLGRSKVFASEHVSISPSDEKGTVSPAKTLLKGKTLFTYYTGSYIPLAFL